MNITFLGGVEEVTGSRYLLEHQGLRILVDCGLFQGNDDLSSRNRDPFPVEPTSIHAIVLTHAHIDHTGYIPVLVKNGFRGAIYCSKPTYALCSILLLDSARLYEEGLRGNDKHKNTQRKSSNKFIEVPLYTTREAEQALELFRPIDYDTTISLQSLQVTLIQSYHILGASFVTITDGKTTLTFSGDLGRPHQLIMKTPPYLKQTDYLVLESTYGDRLHNEGDPMQVLGEIILETVAKGGKLLIPTFAVGRSQAILYCLYQLQQKKVIPHIPIFLDSPMAIKVTNLFCKFPDEHVLSPQACNDIFGTARHTATVEESKQINAIEHPIIIIAGSGMADGGRSLHHLIHLISDAKNTILFVGYQGAGTNGRALLEGAKEIKILGKMYPVHAEIKMIDTLSAHADYNEVLEWLSYFETDPKKVFLTHGEVESAGSLKDKIEERLGWQVFIPHYLESFDLD